MGMEDEYIIEKFHQNFIHAKPENIVLYGTGVHTGALLDSIEDKGRIAGLMDAAKTGQVIYGFKVLSYEEVARLAGNVCIVIIARNSVIHTVYRRIQPFARKNGIPVYNINGKELRVDAPVNGRKKCFSLNKADLVKKLDKAGTVSFDIFDTLLCRSVLRHEDVFRLMDETLYAVRKGYVFSEERIRAESELAIKNYNIQDIYDKFQENTGIPDSEKECLISLELQTERSVLAPRKGVCEIFECALKAGKKVYLISDTYIPSRLLKGILADKGIAGYDRLVVSADYKSSKREHLFELARDALGIDTSHWLHIGCSQSSDIDAPGRLGIDTYRIYGTIQMLGQSVYAGILECGRSIEENVVIAAFAAKAYNNPWGGFSSRGNLKVSSAADLAEFTAAPLFMKYTVWLANHLSENDLVLFPSRDGFILKKIYEKLKGAYAEINLPESVYFYTSRRAALVAAAKEARDIRYIIRLPSPDPPQAKARARFEVDNVCMDGECSVTDGTMERLLDASAEERGRYTSYLEKLGILDAASPVLVDFVAVGTVQEALQRMTGKEFAGAYFYRRRPDSDFTKELQCRSMYGMAGDFETEANIYKYYYFLETVASSYEPAFKRISEDGGYEFFAEERSGKAIEMLKEMHAGILEYCGRMFEIFPCIGSLKAGVGLYDELAGFFGKGFMDIEKGILEEIVNYDEFLGKKVTDLNR